MKMTTTEAKMRAEIRRLQPLVKLADARAARDRKFEDELLAAIGGERARGDHEAFQAVEPALKLARMELGLGQLTPLFYTRTTNETPRGFAHRDALKVFWVAVDQSPGDMVEAALHEIEHLRQMKAGDRRPEAEREAAATAFGEHWGGILRKAAYAW